MPVLKALIACAVLVVGASMASGQTMLSWKLQEGDRFDLQVEQRTSSTATVVNKTVTTTIEMVLESTWSVEKMAGDVATIRQKVTRAMSKVQAGDQAPVEYDTAKAEQPSSSARYLAADLKALVEPESSILLTMNPQGEILSAELSPTLAELWADEKTSGPAKKEATSSLEAILRLPLVVLPGKQVSAGETWTTTRKLTTPAGNFTQATKYTYEGPRESSGVTAAAIAFSSTLTDAASSKTKIKEQSQTGTALFAAQAGRLVSAQQTQKLVTETPYREATITVVIESQVKRTLTPSDGD